MWNKFPFVLLCKIQDESCLVVPIKLGDLSCVELRVILLRGLTFVNFSSSDKDIPDFPVDDALFSTVKQRVQLARELDKLELASRRNSVQTNWFQKALKDMDMICDGSDLYPFN